MSLWRVVALCANLLALHTCATAADAKSHSKAAASACGPGDEHCEALDDAFVALQVHHAVSSGSARANEAGAAPPQPASAHPRHTSSSKQTLVSSDQEDEEDQIPMIGPPMIGPPMVAAFPPPMVPMWQPAPLPVVAEPVAVQQTPTVVVPPPPSPPPSAPPSASPSGTPPAPCPAFSTDCTQCFPQEGKRAHLRSPCGRDPNHILPPFEAQQTANCPFLGTLTNEGVIPFDWIINETLWRAASYAGSDTNGHSMLPGVEGAFSGNFRDHSLWVDKTHKVKDLNGAEVDCRYWYLNPTNMEGMSNEHSSSVGISDCPTDWANCAFDCSSAGEWFCQPLNTATETYAQCKDKLPNVNQFNKFVKTVTGSATVDEEGYVTTCDIGKFASTVDLVHAMEAQSGSVKDFHFFTPVESFGTDCDHSFTDSDGTFLEQLSQGTGGHIGGSIVGGYVDLIHYFGEIDPTNPDKQCDNSDHKYFRIKVKDLRRIDIERKLPCSFDRAKLFEWMHEHNGVTDRRKDQSGWFLSCR